MNTYPIKYKVEFGDFTVEDLQKDDFGGCDNLVLVSVMGTPCAKETLSVKTFAMSGKNEPLDSYQVFAVISMVIAGLKDLEELEGTWQGHAARAFFEICKSNVVKS